MRYGPCLMLGLSSCLYVGGINHAPEGEVGIDPARSTLWKEGEALLAARVNDPDSDGLTYEWRVTVQSREDGKTYGLAPGGSDEVWRLSQDPPEVIGSTRELLLRPLPRRGTYHAEVAVTDAMGATRSFARSFEVENQNPQVQRVRIERDPQAAGDRVPDLTGFNPGHAHYEAFIAESDVVDHEGDVRCGGQSTVSWALVQPDSAALEYWEVLPCQGGLVLGQVRFRLRASEVRQKTSVVVQATVEDGFGGQAVTTGALEVVPDRPPCILSTTPDFAFKRVVVLHDEGLRFDASSVTDDVSEALSYTWLSREEGAVSWSRLPGVSGAVWQMPPGFGLAGGRTQIRVAVQGLAGAFPSCAPTTDSCAEAPGLPEACYEWVTWNVEFQ